MTELAKRGLRKGYTVQSVHHGSPKRTKRFHQLSSDKMCVMQERTPETGF